METFLLILVILLSSVLSFLVGYAVRKHQEEKIKRKVWSNIVRRIHISNIDLFDPSDTPKNDNFGIVDTVMDEYYKDWGESDLEKLNRELKLALEDENYEKAARIRDILDRLGS